MGMKAIPVTFDGQSLPVALDDEVDSTSTNFPLGCDAEPGTNKPSQDFTFKRRFSAPFFVFKDSQQRIWILSMLYQPAAKISGPQVRLDIQGMDHPHLVAGTACGNVVSLLEHLLVAKGERTACGCVDHGKKHYVSLIALELSRGAAEDSVAIVDIGRYVRME